MHICDRRVRSARPDAEGRPEDRAAGANRQAGSPVVAQPLMLQPVLSPARQRSHDTGHAVAAGIGATLDRGRVKLHSLTDQDIHAPAVGNDVVHVEMQHMLAIAGREPAAH